MRPSALTALPLLVMLAFGTPACLDGGGDAEALDGGGFGGFGGEGGFGGALPGDDACSLGCQWLADCGLCWPDAQTDMCLDGAGCVDQCERLDYTAIASCVSGLPACSDDAGLDACFDDPGPPPDEDACARGCAALDGCGLCDVDASGACLELADCAQACRDAGGEARNACLGELTTCDEAAIEACTDADPDPDPDPTDDDCALGCVALDECGYCEPDANDDCLSVDDCAAACRADTEAPAVYQCLAALEDCDEGAINACYGDVPPDPGEGVCADGCGALDACGLCLPDANDDCLGVAACAQACRDEGLEALAQCFVDVVECDEAAIDACFAGE